MKVCVLAFTTVRCGLTTALNGGRLHGFLLPSGTRHTVTRCVRSHVSAGEGGLWLAHDVPLAPHALIENFTIHGGIGADERGIIRSHQ
jgi:hypothetical protein